MSDNLLSHPEAVEQVLSRRPCGLLTDIDGTISAIAPRPVDAVVSARCRQRLGVLVGLLDLVAVVSGRPVLDAQRMVGLPNLLYVGDHGLERTQGGTVVPDPRAGPYREEVRACAAELFRRLSGQLGLEGLFLEDKGVSFSFHYRACPDPVQARALILEATASLDIAARLQVMEARRAVELRPPVDASKGTVLRELAEEFGLRGLLYLGDDYTDVSAFRALRAWRGDSPEEGTPTRSDTGRKEDAGESAWHQGAPPTATPGGQGRPPLRPGDSNAGAQGCPPIRPGDSNAGALGCPPIRPGDSNAGAQGCPPMRSGDSNVGGQARPPLRPRDSNAGAQGCPPMRSGDSNVGGQARPPLRPGDSNAGGQGRPPIRPGDSSARRGAPALERAGYPGDDPWDDKVPDRRGFPAPPARRGLAIAVVSEGSPVEVQSEADFVLEGVPQVEEFLGLLARLLRPET